MKAPIELKRLKKKLIYDTELERRIQDSNKAIGFLDAALENFNSEEITDNKKKLGIDCLLYARSYLVKGEQK